jgi:hypothetical protein
MSHEPSGLIRICAVAVLTTAVVALSGAVTHTSGIAGAHPLAGAALQAGRIAPPPTPPAGAEKRATIVKAPDSPVQLDRAIVFTAAEAPPVLLYSATNLTMEALDQFTLIAFVFNAEGTLKATQIAPGRRTHNAQETKYSSMVLDGSPIEPTDVIVVGVNQAQRVNSEQWWRADLQAAAEATQRRTSAAR